MKEDKLKYTYEPLSRYRWIAVINKSNLFLTRESGMDDNFINQATNEINFTAYDIFEPSDDSSFYNFIHKIEHGKPGLFDLRLEMIDSLGTTVKTVKVVNPAITESCIIRKKSDWEYNSSNSIEINLKITCDDAMMLYND